MAENGTLETGGARIAWWTEGEGADVVLVHAGGADHRLWDLVAPLVARRHRVIRFDLRGHGDSTFPPGTYSHARDLIAVVDELSTVGPVAVAGSSFGGLVALEAALDAPDRFHAMLLLAPALRGHRWSPESLEFWEDEERAIAEGDIDGAIELGIERHGGSLDAEHRDLLREMQRRAFELQMGVDAEEHEPVEATAERLRDVHTPTLVAVGEHDYADFHAIADRLGREVRKARTSIVPGAGHLIPFERPRETAGMLNEIAARS